jgi:hypothetical protein
MYLVKCLKEKNEKKEKIKKRMGREKNTEAPHSLAIEYRSAAKIKDS